MDNLGVFIALGGLGVFAVILAINKPLREKFLHFLREYFGM